MIDDGMRRAIVGFVVSILLLVACAAGYFGGYRQGQIDAAQDVVKYTVIEGQIVHIEGPAPERPAEPRDIEKGVSK